MQLPQFLRVFMAAWILLFMIHVKAADRPNVVFILADDLGWRDLSIQGSSFYETPNIDKRGVEQY